MPGPTTSVAPEPYPSYLDATQTAKQGWELAKQLKRSPHRPANKTARLDMIADQAIAIQAAGTRAGAIAAFTDSATPAIAAAAIAAFV